MELNELAQKIRRNAALWRDHILNEQLNNITLPNDDQNSALQHAQETITNLQLATKQTKKLLRKKNPTFNKNIKEYEQGTNLEETEETPNVLSYTLAEQSGILANALERSLKDTDNIGTFPEEKLTIQQLAEKIFNDSTIRLRLIKEGYRLIEEADSEQ